MGAISKIGLSVVCVPSLKYAFMLCFRVYPQPLAANGGSGYLVNCKGGWGLGTLRKTVERRVERVLLNPRA